MLVWPLVRARTSIALSLVPAPIHPCERLCAVCTIWARSVPKQAGDRMDGVAGGVPLLSKAA